MSEPVTATVEPLEAVNPPPVKDVTDIKELVKQDAINLRDLRKATEQPEPEPEPQPEVKAAEPEVKAETATETDDEKKPVTSRKWYQQQQARIDALTRERAERDTRIAALETRLGQLEKPTATEPAKPAATDAEPTPDQFETYEQYVKAQARWEARQEIRAELDAERERRQSESMQRAQREALGVFHQRVAKARETYADYDAVVGQDLALSAAMTEVIVLSDHGADLAYYLGQHPDECRRIFALPPVRQASELGRLEARLAGADPGSPAPTQPVTKAAAPIKPVGSAPTASTSLESLVAPTQVSLKRINAAMQRR